MLYLFFLVQRAIDPKKYESCLLRKSYQIHLQYYFITTILCLYLYYSCSKSVSRRRGSFELMMHVLPYFLVKLTTSFYLPSMFIFSFFNTWSLAYSNPTPWWYLHICVCALVDVCVYVSHVLMGFVHFGVYLYLVFHP